MDYAIYDLPQKSPPKPEPPQAASPCPAIGLCPVFADYLKYLPKPGIILKVKFLTLKESQAYGIQP